MKKVRGLCVLVVGLAAAASACTRETGSSPTIEASPGTSPSLASPAAVPTAPCSSSMGGKSSFSHLLAVRIGDHLTFDRTTFEFEYVEGNKGVPEFEIREVNPPITEDPSDKPVELAGSVFSQIVFHGASGVDIRGENFREIYQGPKEFATGFEVLEELQQTGDFEATLTWAFGLNRRSCWQLSELSDPIRLVVDFPH